MSVRRELSALWSGCDTLRDRMGPLPAQPRPEARRALEVAYEELASALRRLGSAKMLTSTQVGELEHAQAGLAAARSGGLPLATAVARYAQALQEVATSFHIRLSPPSPTWHRPSHRRAMAPPTAPRRSPSRSTAPTSLRARRSRRSPSSPRWRPRAATGSVASAARAPATPTASPLAARCVATR